MTSPGRWIASIVVIALLAMAAVVGMREASVGINNIETSDVVPSLSSSQSLKIAMLEMPDADLRSALRDLCTRKSQEPRDSNWSLEETQSQIQALNELKRGVSNRLSASSSAEHLHLAALLDSGSVSRVELIERAVVLNPNDAFVLWGAVNICSEERSATTCPLLDWEQRLLELDGQNSESWIRVAANRYQAGNLDSALDALRNAATSAVTQSYWAETIEMAERGFAAVGDYAFPERAAMAFGFAASQLPDYGDFVTMCKEQSAKSVDWTYACLAYGELVEYQGRTDMEVLIARSIQKLALEVLGDVQKFAAMEQRQQVHRQEMLDFIRDNYG